MNTPSFPINLEPCDFCTFSEDQAAISFTQQTFSFISLQKCIRDVMGDIKSRTLVPPNVVIDVEEKMLVSTNKQTLLSIYYCLLEAIITSNKNYQVHISAKLIGNITLTHIRCSHAEYNDEIAASLKRTEPMAESLGGCITVSNDIHGLTLAFTFINH